MRPITITGAGLAGLALGNALQAADVPTTIHEADVLPRHRVCGEFLCGRGAAALEALGLGGTLEDALRHETVHWHFRNELILRADLPAPAYGISRFLLDARLADRFRKQGGHLVQRSRLPTAGPGEGRVLCNGRQAARSEWIGLKLHCTDLETRADLELHLGANGYLGMSRVEDGRTNVCGLFKRRPELKGARETWLCAYLDACGLGTVAARVRRGGIDPASHAGVAGIQFTQLSAPGSDALRLGDAYSVIPPFTGNGMSVALESAEIAFPEILAYARGQQDWEDGVRRVQRQCRERFDGRLKASRRLHPWISRRTGQHALAALARLRMLPFRFLYARTH